MSMREAWMLVLGLATVGGFALADSPNLGTPIPEKDIKAWDLSVLPDGENMPPGGGTPQQGEQVYNEKCAMCHAKGGKGFAQPGASALVGGPPLTSGIDVPKTILNYYAYATTIFDYIRRAMPYNAPGSLTNDEVYALTAYILSLNKLIGPNATMNAKTLPQVKMPNRDNFTLPYPDRI